MSAPTRYVESSRYIGQDDLEDATEAHLEEGQAPAPPRGQAPARPYSSRSFASGRNGGRRAERPERRSGQAHQAQRPSAGHPQGIPEFPEPLPGYHYYRTQDEVLPHQPLDVGPAEPYYSKGMAHGVQSEQVPHGGRPAPAPDQRAQLAASRKLVREELHPKVDPVPVVIVQQGGGPRPLRRAVLSQKTVAAPGADPMVLVPRDPHRRSVRLLNESAVQPVRILFDLALTGGAVLPPNMGGYLEIKTEDEICAYASGAQVPVTGQPTQQSTGSQTSPTAGTVITSIAGLAAGLYQVQWQVSLGGTTSSTEADNFGLYVGASQQMVSMSGTGSGSVYPQTTVNLQVPTGATVSIQAIATATAGAVYRAQMVLTPLTQASTSPALVSVITEYDAAGGN